MKNTSLFRISMVVLLLMNSPISRAQHLEGAPKSLTQLNGVGNTLSYPQLLANYQTLMASTDQKKAHEQKMAQRWWNYSFLNYNIDPGGASYSSTAYSEARRAIYTSSLNCGNNDPANWVSDGPYNAPDNSFGQGGGWVEAIYCHPTNTNRILVGTRTSGIMRTNDGGTTWASVTDDVAFPVLGVRQILAAPNNPNYLLAITGTLDIKGGPIYSTDAGETWNEVTGSVPELYWIDFHPTIDGLVFATSKLALAYSTDYGATWSWLGTPGLDASDYHYMIHANEDNLFFNIRNKWIPQSKLYKADFSISGGVVSIDSWNNLTASYTSPGKELRFSNFSNNVGDRFYMYIKELDPISSAINNKVFKSTDGGETFTPISASLPWNESDFGAFNKGELIASPNDPNTFYAGSVKRMRKYNDITGTYVVIGGAAGNEGHHDDYRCSQILDMGSEDRILLGNDGGPALVENGLATSPKIQSLNGDLSINLIHAFDVHEQTGRVAYAFQDQRMLYRDPDNTYSAPFIHEGSLAMIQQDYPDAIVGEDAYYGIKDRTGSPHPIVGSGLWGLGPTVFDLGGYAVLYRNHPERFARGLNPAGKIAVNREAFVSEVITIPGASHGIGPVAVCETQVERMYAAGKESLGNTNKLFRSNDDGLTWENITDASVSLDGGTNSELLSNLLMWTHVRAIAVDHTNKDILYCGIGGTHEVGGVITDERFRVIKSEDGGDSFTDYSAGLPALPVERLLTIEDDDDLIFCATSVGIYYRNKHMNAWECFSKNLPKVSITGLKYNYCENTLYASTYGRGMWKTEVNLTIASSYTEDITSNTNWDTPRRVNSHILVKSGNTLTITSEVKMAKGRKIMVEAGAKLDINGGVLTSSCNQFWGGIEVWGNHLLSQANPTDQGYLLIRNNSLIENAREAINVTKQGAWSKTGGIVTAFNSTFKNNWRSVAYAPYHSYSTADPSFEQPNKGQFDDCQFIKDDNIWGNTIVPHITMYDVYGVRIVGCDFFDNRTTGVIDRSYAIYSLDAGFKVLGKNLNWAGGVDQSYDETDYDIGHFRNHKGGIYAMNANSNYAVTVDHCLFENCHQGIDLSLVDNAVITRNKFEFNNAHPADIVEMYQCNIEHASGYKVEGNLFVNLTDSDVAFGVIAQWTGNEQNQIYRNRYENMSVSNASVGYNGNGISLEGASSGLQWLCNEYVSSQFADQYIYDAGIYDPTAGGVRLQQGNLSQSTGNQYSSALGASITRKHLASIVANNTYYYSAPTDPLPLDPTKLSGNVFQINTASSSHQCPSSFPTFQVSEVAASVFTGSISGGFANELIVVDNDFNNATQALDVLLSNGDSPALHNMVDMMNTNNHQQVKQNLEAASPYLSKKLLIKVGEKSTQLYPHHWYRKLITLNPEIAKDASFIQFLKNKQEPLPQSMIAQVEALYQNGPSQRGVKLDALTRLDDRKSELSNLLIINEQSKTTQINWVAHQQLLTKRGDQMLVAQLADDYLSLGEINQCDQQLDQITANQGQLNNQALQQELADFVTFKKYVLTLIDQNGTISSLSQTHLQNFANSLTGRAKTQAQNMLCFHFGQCEENYPTIASGSSNRQSVVGNEQNRSNEEFLETMAIAPNPNNGRFDLLFSNSIAVESIQVFSVLGQAVSVKSEQTTPQKIRIELPQQASGSYMVMLIDKQGNVYKAKFLVEQ